MFALMRSRSSAVVARGEGWRFLCDKVRCALDSRGYVEKNGAYSVKCQLGKEGKEERG
jgi:hypothetical protein